MLSDAVPVDFFKEQFPDLTESVSATTPREFLVKQQAKLPGICMFIWDEMVHRGMVGEPMKISPIVNNGFRRIHQFVKEELRADPISEAFSAKYYNNLSATEAFAEISLVKCFPEDIHIADVEFSDNRRPLDFVDPTREFREFHGLRAFPIFLERLKAVASSHGAKRISLLVAYPPLYGVFSRYGFVVSNTEMAQKAYKLAGRGFPMILNI